MRLVGKMTLKVSDVDADLRKLQQASEANTAFDQLRLGQEELKADFKVALEDTTKRFDVNFQLFCDPPTD